MRWGDFIVLNASFFLGFWLKFRGFEFVFAPEFSAFFLLINLFWLIASSFLKTYDPSKQTDYDVTFSNLFQVFVFHFLLIAALNGWVKTYYSRLFLIYGYGVWGTMMFLWRFYFVWDRKKSHREGKGFQKTLIVGYTPETKDLGDLMQQRSDLGYSLLGYIDDRHPKALTDLAHFEEYCEKHGIQEVFAALGALRKSQLKALIQYCDFHLIRLRLIPEYKGFEYAQLKTDFLGHVPVFYLRVSPLDMPLNRWIKRVFDVIFSSIIILLVLWWLLPILGIIIKLESKGPIFFKQKRSGINNRDFYCYKLRSMSVNRDQDQLQAVKGDRRITRFGAFLRKTSLDELPQFFNVWWGDMSVVGPRPHMIAHTEQYRQMIDQYMVRHWIKPGVTGLSQVKGYRGETTDPRMMKNRIKVDVFYLEHWTFLLDLKVVLLTVYNAIRGEENAH